MYEIGKVYTFYYSAETENKDSRPKVRRCLSRSTVKNLHRYLVENADQIRTRMLEQFSDASKIGCQIDLSKDLKGEEKKLAQSRIDSLKKSFHEKWDTPKEKKSPRSAALSLFIRNYKPERIGFKKEDAYKVRAMYAGQYCTVTGKVLDKWYTITPHNVVFDYVTPEMETFFKHHSGIVSFILSFFRKG